MGAGGGGEGSDDLIRGEMSKSITAGCSQNAGTFNSLIQLLVYKLAAAGC